MNNLPANNLKGVFTTRLILSAGLLVGILDGIAAIISYLVKGGKHPEKIFHFIASAVFGSTALKGGTDMLIAGIAFRTPQPGSRYPLSMETGPDRDAHHHRCYWTATGLYS